MTAFEYKVDVLNPMTGKESSAHLSARGLDGWELISVVYHPEINRHEVGRSTFSAEREMFYFKRRIEHSANAALGQGAAEEGK